MYSSIEHQKRLEILFNKNQLTLFWLDIIFLSMGLTQEL